MAETIKVQNFPNGDNYNPGWVSNKSQSDVIKNNPQYGFPVPLIGPSTIPLPGILSFNPLNDDSNKFQGCIGNKDGEAQYVSFAGGIGNNGENGSDLKINLNFRNLLGDTSDNIGQIFNDDLSVVTSSKTETLNSITTDNNSIVYYPYQLFQSSDKQNLSFKKIYFIPVYNNGNITSYQVKIRNSFKKIDNTSLWDFNITDIDMIETSDEDTVLNSPFVFYNNNYGPEQKIENKTIYINREGNITFAKEVFTGNSESIHNSKVRLSFLFSNLEVDDKTKRYMENPSDKTKNFKYRYKNLKKDNFTSITYNSVQITLFTQSETDIIYTDDDIVLPRGTILFSYGSIPTDFTSPLIGLSNHNSVSSDDSISFDKFLDTQWLDENGYGVPKLKALLGLQYSATATETGISIRNSAHTFFSSNNINSVQGETETNLKLTIEDSSWGTYYSDIFKNTEYYVKIIDLGEYLPSKLYVAIQSIYDFETYNENRFNYYSSIGGISDSSFTGLITDWEGYLSLDTDKLLNTSGIDNTWVNVYNSDNSSSASLNSNIHKIFVRKHVVGTFDSTTGEYTDTTTTGENTDPTTDHYLLKIIYTLQSDLASEPIQSIPLYVTKDINTSGPFHFSPIYSNLSYPSGYLSNIITFTIDGIIDNANKGDYLYKIELYDYKGNANRKGYGFKLELSTGDEVLQQVTDKLTEFPSLSFTVLKGSDKQYKLKIENDRKFPYFGVKITNSSTTDNNDLTFSRGINFTVKDNSTLIQPTLSLFLNTDEETILKWQLIKDTNTDFGSQSYTFKINYEESNTIDLTNNDTLADFFTKMNTFIKYTNNNVDINDKIIKSKPENKEKYSIQCIKLLNPDNTTTTKYENMDLSTLKIEGETDNNIYFPFIIPKSKRDYTTITSKYNTELALLYNSEKFIIYNNKYYLDFPLGTTNREFPETIGSKTLTTLENCIVIEFTCSNVDSSKNLDITKLDFTLTPTTSGTELRYVVKLKGELKSSITSSSGSSGSSGSGAKGIDFNDLFDFDDNDLDYRDFEKDEDLFDKEFMDFINENVNRNQKRKEKKDDTGILYRGTGEVGEVEEEGDYVYLFSDEYLGTININSLEKIEGGRIYIGFDETPNVDSDTFNFDITINKGIMSIPGVESMSGSISSPDEFKFNYRILYP